MPNNLTMTSATYAASSPFGQALTAGRGITATPVVLAMPFTVSLRIKCLPSGGVRVCASQNLCFWIAINAAGELIANYWNGATNVSVVSTTVVADDSWKHIQFSLTSGGATLYANGALVASNAAAASPAFSAAFGVGQFAGANLWVGSIDEVAVFSGVKDASAFTSPTAPYADSAANLLAIYHLDGNGNDSIAVASVIAANNAGIFYSPYNWLVNSSYAKTINSGAYFRTLFSGDSCTLRFDMTGNISPFSKLKIVVDGVTNQFAIAAASVVVTMPTGQDNQVHLLEVYVDATSRSIDRWSIQQAAVKFTQLEILGGAGTVTLPQVHARRVLIYGDSITDGTYTLNDFAAVDVDRDSSSVSWVNRLRHFLAAEVGAVGFASQGLNAGGIGAVPRLNLAYNLLWAGQTRSFTPEPNFVIWLMGTNDSTNNTQANGILALNGMMAAMPTAKFAIFRPLINTNQEANLQAIVAGCSDPSRAVYISTNGYWVTADSPDSLHPYGYAGEKIAMKMTEAINTTFLSVAQTPTVPTLTNPSGVTAGQFASAGLFNVAGVTAGVDIPIITGPGVQVKVATSSGGTLGAAQTGTVNVRLGYDVQVLGLAGTSGSTPRALSYGGLLLTFNVITAQSGGALLLAPSRTWKVGESENAGFAKNAEAILDYGFDWSDYIPGDSIIDVDITTSGGITSSTVLQSDSVVGLLIDGGVVNTPAQVTCKITTAFGREDERTIDLDIR